jgi:ABC-2 type transport system permease protein
MSAAMVAPAWTSVRLGARLRATAGGEWIKFRSVRSSPTVLVGTAVVLLVGAWLICGGYRSGWSTLSAHDKAVFDPTFQSVRAVELAQLFIGALGVLSVTGEYTSGLIRGTFIATPQRVRVLAMKALIFALVVGAWCTVLSFAAFCIGQSVLTGHVPHASLGEPGVLRAVLGGGFYLTLVGLLGLFIGVLVRRTAAALAVLFGVLLVAPLVAAMLPGDFGARLTAYLPSSAGADVYQVVRTAPHQLGPSQGAGLLTLYVAITIVAAFVTIRRRDV